MPKFKRSPFEKARKAENGYGRALKQIANEIGNMVKRFGEINPQTFPGLKDALERYAEILRPWAKAKALSIVELVEKDDKRAWMSATEEMGTALRHEIHRAPVGQRMQELVNENVELITSLPRKAAQRVQELAIKALEGGERGQSIVEEIMRTGEVTKGRAETIARTEIGRATTALTQARAEYIGSEGYIWRTAHDSDVRPSHAKMEGKFVRWDSPPTLDGMTGHAGQFPNCRCYCEPVIPNNLLGATHDSKRSLHRRGNNFRCDTITVKSGAVDHTVHVDVR
jgi:SPP1 gp7 family putative phage head morphogenesis protein